MDAAIVDQLFQRDARHFAAHRIERGNDYGFRRIIDDQINARRGFQRADVAALATDDASLHIIVGQGDHGNGGFRHMIRRALLNGGGDDIARLLIRLFLGALFDFAHHHGGVVISILLNAVDQDVFGFLAGHVGDALQLLLLAIVHFLRFGFQTFRLAMLFVELFFAQLQIVHLLIYLLLAGVYAAFQARNLAAAVANFLIQFVLQADNFFLGFQDSFLFLILRLARRFLQQALCVFLRLSKLLFHAVLAIHIARDRTDDQRGQRGNYGDNDTSSTHEFNPSPLEMVSTVFNCLIGSYDMRETSIPKRFKRLKNQKQNRQNECIRIRPPDRRRIWICTFRIRTTPVQLRSSTPRSGRFIPGTGSANGSICVSQTAALRNKNIITVGRPDFHPAEYRTNLIFIPLTPFCDHVQPPADFQSVEALFNKALCHGKIRLVRRIGKDDIEARRIHALKAVGQTDADIAHAVPHRVPARYLYRHRIDIGHENILFSGDLRRRDANDAAPAAKIHYAQTRLNFDMRKHRQRTPIHMLRRKQPRIRFEQNPLAQNHRFQNAVIAYARHAAHSQLSSGYLSIDYYSTLRTK